MSKIFSILTIASILATASPALAVNYDVFVDKDNTTGMEDGTESHPYDTISEAVAKALLNDKNNRKIYIANGEYIETVVLGEYVKLYGENKNKTIINGRSNKRTVKMEDHSQIKNIKVYGGKTGIYVNEEAKVSIKKVKVTKTKRIGIEILKSDRNDKEKATIEDSKIYDNKGKGFYIKTGKIEIVNNEIYDNDEEGIDIRSRVSGKIKNNDIYDNDESGIEVIVGSSNLKIRNNSIKGNDASGLALQYYSSHKESKKLGNIKIFKNSFKKNKKYGLACNSPSDKMPVVNYWKTSTTLSDNIFLKNKLNTHKEDCHL